MLHRADPMHCRCVTGCPASPLLFDLYFGALEDYMAGQGLELHMAF